MTVSEPVTQEVQYAAVYVTANTHIDNYVLAANTPETITRPTNGNYVMFSADGDFWAAYGRTASTGSTDITDGSGSELNPAVRAISSGTTISVSATAARKISCMWFK